MSGLKTSFFSLFFFGTDIAIRLLLTHQKRSMAMKRQETKISARNSDNGNIDWDR
jgi:hypothetical protein